MAGSVEPLMPWLMRHRRTSIVQLGLMGHYYDLDGAMAAGQPELAWRARAALLVSGIELYLCRCGANLANGTDFADQANLMLGSLAVIDRNLGNEAWELLLADAPDDLTLIRGEISAVENFLLGRLGIESAVSRSAAIRSWADSARLVREFGRKLGVAGSDSWYLPEDPDLGSQAGWYDEVMAIVEQQA